MSVTNITRSVGGEERLALCIYLCPSCSDHPRSDPEAWRLGLCSTCKKSIFLLVHYELRVEDN